MIAEARKSKKSRAGPAQKYHLSLTLTGKVSHRATTKLNSAECRTFPQVGAWHNFEQEDSFHADNLVQEIIWENKYFSN